ncbi:unnamed protein product [Parascedosporium putredinis]|uniref:Uncharacterized protein n=1 Tax=Parascedosporium putredinis TaxID=1442378 RepID=A0A9P1GXW7_9PEZI|nr:unnamed protein product [Parascedosporium putredinis]CAI7991074.1 unnamed protein product [Parascedosporium putredinis]
MRSRSVQARLPFPVVLAIHGAPDAWPEDLSIKLDLSRNLDPAKGLAPFETVWLNATNVRKGLPEDEGTYFATVGLLEAAGTPRGPTTCGTRSSSPRTAPRGLAAQRMADEDLITGEDGGYGTVYFELDDDKGVEPDVSASKDDGERCRVDFPEDLGARVAAKLLDIGKCANETTKSAEHDVYCNSKPILVEGQTVAAEDSDSEGGEGEGGSTGRGGQGAPRGVTAATVLVLRWPGTA